MKNLYTLAVPETSSDEVLDARPHTPLQSAEDVRDFTFEAREALAKDLFDRTQVLSKIKTAASRGRMYLRVLQDDHPVDLRLTKYAFGLERFLNAKGFSYRWETVSWQEFLRGRETGEVIEYPELIIFWHGGKIGESDGERTIEQEACSEHQLG